MKLHVSRFVVALMIFACPLTFAQEADAPAPDAPELALLHQSIDFLSSLPAFSAELTMKFELVDSDAQTQEGSLTGKLDISGEDKARFRVDTEDGTMELYFSPDGKFLYLSAENQYIDGKTFGDRKQALTVMPGREYRPGQIMLSDMLHSDPTLLKALETATRIGADGDGPDSPIHIKAKGGGLTTDFWIRPGDQPFIEKFSVDLLEMAKEAGSDLTKILVTYTITEWNRAPEFPADHFTFKKPEGATELDTSGGASAGGLAKGKPAPSIKLGMLGEGTFDLAAHKGTDVVVLDFWASWCGPCRKGLPIAAEVTSQFKDRNVVFYAVNIGEEAQVAQAFLDQTGLKIPVALDLNREAAQKYQANSIPMMVIIGKDGNIHEIYRGLAPTFRDDLSKTLSDLTK